MNVEIYSIITARRISEVVPHPPLLSVSAESVKQPPPTRTLNKIIRRRIKTDFPQRVIGDINTRTAPNPLCCLF